jgi:hypothetical protein
VGSTGLTPTTTNTQTNASLLDSLLQGTGLLGPAGGQTGTQGTQTANSGPNVNAGMAQLLNNPLMSAAAMGFDNMYRAFLAPYMARFGNNAAFHFLRGGFDNMAPVWMSDLMGQQLARSTGMNPMITSLFTGRMMDTPDSYLFTNLLFNMNSQNGQQQQGGMPAGASQGNTNANNILPLFLLTGMW